MTASSRRPTCRALVTATAAAVGFRALLMATQDGYGQAGLWALAWHGLGRDVADGLLWAVPAAVLIGLALRARQPTGIPAVAAWLLLALLIDLFLVGVWPHRPLHVPGASSTAGQAAHLVAGGLSLATAALATLGRRSVWPPIASVAALSMVAALTGLLATGTRADRPDVVLISLDTLRPDRLGCYGHSVPTSPELDRFARRSRRFTAAFSPEPWTLTAHASLLTSRHPVTHGVGHDRRLAPDVPTLARRLGEQGWVTVAIVDSVVWMDPRYGLDSGFDIYRPVWGTAAEKRAVVSDVLADLGDRPCFLFLHCFDAHSGFRSLPYDADEQDLDLIVGERDQGFGCESDPDCASEWLQGLNRDGRVPEADVVRRLMAYYDAGVRSLDRQVGAVFEDLRRHHRWDGAFVVVTADHGEEFFEHGRSLHSQLYEECVAVPLLIAGPGIAPGVSGRLVSLLDIGPTLLELAGVRGGLGSGLSLVPELNPELSRPGGSLPAPEPLLLVNDVTSMALRTDGFKLIRRGETYELYDLRADPAERRELLAGDAPPEELKLALQLAWEAAREARDGPGDSSALDRPVLAAEEIERLQALGYLGER